MKLIVTGDKTKIDVPQDELYITSHLNAAISESAIMAKAVIDAFQKFVNADYGDTHPDDAKMNDEALKTRDGRVLARYQMPPEADDDIFISLEFDEPSTGKDVCLIMFCMDY